MGCRNLDITDYFRLTPTADAQDKYTGDSTGTDKPGVRPG